MEKILLTGGFGYIGSKFIEKFHNKYKIICFDTSFYEFDSEIHHLTSKYVNADIRNLNSELLKDIDYVVHMAELCNDPLSDFDPSLTKEINIDATSRFLDLCNSSNIKKFIYMSSCSVYGFSEEDYVNEKSKVNGLTAYANAKIQNELKLIQSKNNFETIIFRNATAFGFSKNIRLDIVLNDLVYESIKKNSITLLSDGTPIRPMVHISDICNLIDIFIESKENYDKNIFNIGAIDSNFTIKELALNVAEILNISNVSFGNSSPDHRSYKVNFEKLNNEFPFYDFEFDIKKGISELANEFKKVKFIIMEKEFNQY